VPYLLDPSSNEPEAAGVGTADAMARIPGLLITDNVELAYANRLLFVNTCFAKPEKIPESLKWTWVGVTFSQPVAVALITMMRKQDAGKLLEAARAGLPTLLIASEADQQIDLVKVENLMRKDFTNLEVVKFACGHTPFIEEKEKFVTTLDAWATKVLAN